MNSNQTSVPQPSERVLVISDFWGCRAIRVSGEAMQMQMRKHGCFLRDWSVLSPPISTKHITRNSGVAEVLLLEGFVEEGKINGVWRTISRFEIDVVLNSFGPCV